MALAERNSEQNKYGLENVEQRDHQGRDFSCYVGRMEVEVAPDVEVGRSEQYCERRADRCQGD